LTGRKALLSLFALSKDVQASLEPLRPLLGTPVTVLAGASNRRF